MFMNLNQAKSQDAILNHMNDEDHNLLWDISELHKKLDIEYNLCHVACEYIAYTRDHAEIRDGRTTTNYPNDASIFILPEGKIFANSESSYESELLDAIEEQENVRNEDELQKRKLNADVKNSEYLVRVQWWPIAIATLSLGVAAWAIIKPSSEIQELKLELKKIKDTISALHLPKKEDSIHKESSRVEYNTIVETDSAKTDSLN